MISAISGTSQSQCNFGKLVLNLSTESQKLLAGIKIAKFSSALIFFGRYGGQANPLCNHFMFPRFLKLYS